MKTHAWSWSDDEIEEIKKDFQTTYGHLGDDYLLTTLNDRIVACTESFAKARGYGVDELEGQSLSIFESAVTENEREMDAAIAFERMLHQGKDEGTTLHQTRDGGFIAIEYSVRLIEIAGHKFYLHQNRTLQGQAVYEFHSAFCRYFEHLPQPALLINPHSGDMTIVDCNSAYAELLGFSREELIGQPAGDFNPLQDAAAYQNWLLHHKAHFIRRFRDIPRYNDTGLRIHKNGTLIPVRTDMTIVHTDEQELLLVMVSDLSHEQQQQKLDYNRNQIYEAITLGTPIQETLQKIVALLEEQLPESCGTIFLIEKEHLQIGCIGSLSKAFGKTVPLWRNLKDAGPIGQSIYEHRVIYVDNIATSPWSTHAALTSVPNAQSCWIFPLENARQIVGVLVVHSRHSRGPSNQELENIEWVRRLAAIAIQSHRQTERLAFQAEHDHLTGLPNRLLFEDRLTQALAVAQRHNSQVALFMLDLDGFKHVNDTLGHAAGDVLLKEVTQRLQSAVRRSDTVGRLGGDEFVILLSDVGDLEAIETVACKILAAVKAPFDIWNSDIYVTASIGIALHPQQGGDVSALMRNADAAMYRAKNSGRNKYEYFEETLGQEKEDRLRLKAQLRQAFEEKQFEVFYQPQFDVKTRDCIGFEALLRWKHPEFGMILPLSFIPVAEESGIILKIGEWVIEQVCAQIREWRVQGLGEMRVAINISALQFMRSEFFKVLQEAIRKNELKPQSLELELSEGVVMQNVEETARQMMRLHEMGIRLTVDDYGTGYSSLAYLRKLPLSRLKIDQSFVHGIDTNTQARELLNSMILLAHSLKLEVCVEGVEDAREIRVLKELSCDATQGNLLGKPVTASKIEDYVQTQAVKSFLSNVR